MVREETRDGRNRRTFRVQRCTATPGAKAAQWIGVDDVRGPVRWGFRIGHSAMSVQCPVCPKADWLANASPSVSIRYRRLPRFRGMRGRVSGRGAMKCEGEHAFRRRQKNLAIWEVTRASALPASLSR